MENNRNFLIGVIVIGILIALAATYSNARNSQQQNNNQQITPAYNDDNLSPTSGGIGTVTPEVVESPSPETGTISPTGTSSISVVPRLSLTPTTSPPDSF